MVDAIDLSRSPTSSREHSVEHESPSANTFANKETAEEQLEHGQSTALDGVAQVTSNDDTNREIIKPDPSQPPAYQSVAAPHTDPRSGQASQPSMTETVRLQPALRSDTSHPSNRLSSVKETKSENSQCSQSFADDPLEDIEAFDWTELEARFHEKQAEFTAKEQAIMDEFQGLCQSFSLWAAAGANQEADRTFKRLRTQMTLVQHHEEGLAAKRQHYIKVVDAFKSALQLLAS